MINFFDRWKSIKKYSYEVIFFHDFEMNWNLILLDVKSALSNLVAIHHIFNVSTRALSDFNFFEKNDNFEGVSIQ